MFQSLYRVVIQVTAGCLNVLLLY